MLCFCCCEKTRSNRRRSNQNNMKFISLFVLRKGENEINSKNRTTTLPTTANNTSIFVYQQNIIIYSSRPVHDTFVEMFSILLAY